MSDTVIKRPEEMPREREGVSEREGGPGKRERTGDMTGGRTWEGGRTGARMPWKCDRCLASDLSLFLPLKHSEFLSSLCGEGQRGDRATVPTQVRSSQPGTASH